MDEISNMFSRLGTLSPPLFVLLFLFVANFIMRRTPLIKNSLVMWISTAIGTILYPLFVTTVTTFQFSFLRNVLTGFMVGVAAWACYLPVVILIEKKYPWLESVINGPSAPAKEQEKPTASAVENKTP